MEKSDQDNRKSNINIVTDIAEPSLVAKDLVETGVETKSGETNNRHSVTSSGSEIETDKRSVVSTSDSFITELSYCSVEDEWEEDSTNTDGDGSVMEIPRDSLTHLYLFGRTKNETSKTAQVYYKKSNIEEKLWQFVFGIGYEAEFNSKVKQWMHKLCDVVEGKQFDKWKVLENMFLTYSKLEKVTESY